MQLKKPLFLIIIIALSVHVFWSWYFKLYQQIYLPQFQPPDTKTYWSSAEMLYHSFLPHKTRPMGIALIQGFPYVFRATPNFLLWNYLINITAWLGTVICVYQTAFAITQSKRSGTIASLLFIGGVGPYFISAQILSENVYYFLLSAALYCIAMFIAKQKSTYAFMSLIILSYNSIVRPSGYYFYCVVLLFFVVLYLLQKRHKIVLLLVLTYIPIFIQCYQIKITYGVYKISCIDDGALINYWFARANYFKNNSTFEEENKLFYKKIDTLTPKQVSEFAKQEFIQQVKYNSLNLTKAYMYSLYENTKGLSSSLFDVQNLGFSKSKVFVKEVLLFISRVQNIFFTIFGSLLLPAILLKWKRLFKAEELYFLWFCNLIVLYTVLTSAISYWQQDRFHLVFYAIAIVSIVLVLQKIKKLFDPLHRSKSL